MAMHYLQQQLEQYAGDALLVWGLVAVVHLAGCGIKAPIGCRFSHGERSDEIASERCHLVIGVSSLFEFCLDRKGWRPWSLSNAKCATRPSYCFTMARPSPNAP